VGDNRGNVYAVDVVTGELRWTGSVRGFLTVPLAATDDLVIATVQASRSVPPRVVALDASDGSQAWSTDASPSAALATAPAIDGDHAIVGFSDGTVRAYATSDGSEVWAARTNAPFYFTVAPAVAPDAVVAVDSLGQVYRLDPGTGERVWDHALNRSVLRGAPAIAGGTVLVASTDGRLAAIDLSSGKLVWDSEATDSILRSLTLTPDVVIAVRGGEQAGLVGYTVDPAGTLISVASPTVLSLPLLLGAFFVAALSLGAVAILAGRALRSRMGPAFIDDEAPAIADPWEPDGSDDGVDG
jgi:outer membrane protein assembly factor BamB